MDSGTDPAAEAFDEMPLKKPRLDEGSELPAAASLWADIHPDILGVVLRFLPCAADRASVRSVCPRWRAAARGQALPPPLPLLVVPKFRLSCLTSEKALTAPRCSLMPEEVAADGYRYVGSYDGWIVSVAQIHRPYFPHTDDGQLFDSGFYSSKDDKCFLINAFSHRVVHLPQLCRESYICGHLFYKILPVVNGTGDVRFEINGSYIMSPRRVVLSASPDSGSKYIVAASFHTKASGNLALWQPGMTSWHVCSGPLYGPKDIVFYQGKLYVLETSINHLFAFVLEDDDHGIVISRVEQCMTEPFPPYPMEQDGFLICNMVVWRENLLLIIRYNDTDCLANWKTIEVDVFALDINTNPFGLTRIHSFDGDCIFVGSGSSKSFPASLHDGVEGDLIYFVPEYWSPSDCFVYNMTDGKMRPFSANLSPFEGHVKDHFPVWLFPSE